MLTVEHRSAAAIDPVRLRLASRPDGRETHLEMVERPAARSAPDGPPEERVVATLRAATQPMTRQELRDRLRINNQRLGDALVSLEHTGRIARTATGWGIALAPATKDGDLRLF